MPSSSVKAFAYLRVSGRGQVEGDGFDRQLSAIRAYAAAQGLTIARVFREEGVSGTLEGMDRPAWVEMIAGILANGVTTIIIEKLDRLARDLMIQEHIIQDLGRRGITLVSVAEPDLCSDDPTRKLMRQIMGAIAEYDKSMIVLKLRGARQRMRARAGRCEGAKPYGTRPGEADVLATIRSLRTAGRSLQAIAGALNAQGIRPRRGAEWHPYTVARIAER
jgi:DNA invertase Pin-like site-specific DNA recombinase